jgi:tRNA(His) 5'-end guanylyltransferase
VERGTDSFYFVFLRFTEKHGFVKPNDDRGQNLMNLSAEVCMNEINDIVLAYGQSDEYRYWFFSFFSFFLSSLPNFSPFMKLRP